MRFFPPNMYDPQINMIIKLFVLNKKKLKQDFNSPKYENRIKEFFATFSEFLRSYIRDKYYEFINDIQNEVNFFEWFNHYYKPKLLAGRNTNTNNPLIKKEVIKNSNSQKGNASPDNVSITTKTFPISLISQNKYSNSLLQPTYSYSPSQDTPPIILPLTNTHISDNCPLFATTDKINSTKTSHACENSNNNPLSPISDNSYTRQITTNQQDKHSMTSLTPQYHITDNTHLDKKTNANY